ncbi:MAG: hypothetical protein D6715_03515 [Calditrichaeota bacterium]|nr:MAG: hypothetical protein D6715_03515 [Calditrichota bacterium]
MKRHVLWARLGSGWRQGLLWLWLGFTMGCASLSTFQTPATLEKGKAAIGFGASGVNGSIPAILEASGRVGLGRQTDAGVKVTIPGTITGDLKWQWYRSPGLQAAFDVAVSYFNSSENGEDFKSGAVMPALLVGNRHWYAGGRLVFFSSEGTFNFFGSRDFQVSTTFPGLFFGLALGNRLQFMPEVNVYFSTGDSQGALLHYGIGVRYGL